MSQAIRRIAISMGGGYVPGLAGVVRAIGQASQAQGWSVVGIRDGFDGVLFPERYPEGGVIELPFADDDTGSVLGTGVRTDPFRVQRVNEDGLIDDIDASDQVLDALRRHGIDALVAVAGGSAVTGSHALSVIWKLSRKGLRCVCIPKSAENDLDATTQPYGYASILHYASDTLRHIRSAARDQGRVAVVEIPGQHAGCLALEAGLAAAADVVLIPEFPYDIAHIAKHINDQHRASLIILADGARPIDDDAIQCVGNAARLAPPSPPSPHSSPSTATTLPSGDSVIHRSGAALKAIVEPLQRRSNRDLLPLALDQLVRAGSVVAVDRALAAAYGAAAINALANGASAHLVAAQASAFQVLPLASVVNRIRTLNGTSPTVITARTLGICLGSRP